MKFTLDATFLIALYLGGVVVLNTDLTQTLIMIGAAVAGSIVLAYFRRDRDYREIFYKSVCSSISGLVTGAFITKYYEVESREYIIGIYFITSLLSLFFIKGLLSVVEQNASGFIITIFQRILNTGPANGLKITPPAVIETQVVVEKKDDTKEGENES